MRVALIGYGTESAGGRRYEMDEGRNKREGKNDDKANVTKRRTRETCKGPYESPKLKSGLLFL